MQVRQWKKELLENSQMIFEKANKKENVEAKESALHEQIGRLTVENNWLKKKLGLLSLEEKMRVLDPKDKDVKFTGILIENGVQVSMDGIGRALDNIFIERLWRTVEV